MRYQAKLLLVFLMSMVVSNSVLAGTQSGGGGGTISRLLTYAKMHLENNVPLLVPAAMQFDEPELNEWYGRKHGDLANAIAKIQFVPVEGSEPLVDKHFGNTTWIRVSETLDHHIEFKPNEELFVKLAKRELSLEAVTEYLVHELGHINDLNEMDSWKFARQMVAKFQYRKKLNPKRCKIAAPDATKVGGYTDQNIIVKPDRMERLRIGDLQYEFNLDSARFHFEASVKDLRGWKLFHLLVMANDNPASWVMVKPNAFLGIHCNP
jgi:hypothetical protein